MWQDVLVAVGSAIFSLVLLPSILTDRKPHPATSVLTCVVLGGFAITYASMGWVASTLSNALESALWGALFVQTRW